MKSTKLTPTQAAETDRAWREAVKARRLERRGGKGKFPPEEEEIPKVPAHVLHAGFMFTQSKNPTAWTTMKEICPTVRDPLYLSMFYFKGGDSKIYLSHITGGPGTVKIEDIYEHRELKILVGVGTIEGTRQALILRRPASCPHSPQQIKETVLSKKKELEISRFSEKPLSTKLILTKKLEKPLTLYGTWKVYTTEDSAIYFRRGKGKEHTNFLAEEQETFTW